MSGTDREGRGQGSSISTSGALNELGTIRVIVGTVRVKNGDLEVSTVGVGTGSQTIASWAGFLTLYAGGTEDGDGHDGGDQELGVEEHRENE